MVLFPRMGCDLGAMSRALRKPLHAAGVALPASCGTTIISRPSTTLGMTKKKVGARGKRALFFPTKKL